MDSTYCLQSLRKTDTRNLYLFVYLRSYKEYIKTATRLICERAIFAEIASIIF